MRGTVYPKIRGCFNDRFFEISIFFFGKNIRDTNGLRIINNCQGRAFHEFWRDKCDFGGTISFRTSCTPEIFTHVYGAFARRDSIYLALQNLFSHMPLSEIYDKRKPDWIITMRQTNATTCFGRRRGRYLAMCVHYIPTLR